MTTQEKQELIEWITERSQNDRGELKRLADEALEELEAEDA